MKNIKNEKKGQFNFIHQLNEKGYDSFLTFLESSAGISYSDLVSKIGLEPTEENVFNIIFVHESEAIKHNKRREALKDALVRFLQIPGLTWKRSTKAIEERMSVYCHFCSFARNCYNKMSPEERNKRLKKIWDYLEMTTAGKTTWIPKSPGDPVITTAFDLFWPE